MRMTITGTLEGVVEDAGPAPAGTGTGEPRTAGLAAIDAGAAPSGPAAVPRAGGHADGGAAPGWLVELLQRPAAESRPQRAPAPALDAGGAPPG